MKAFRHTSDRQALGNIVVMEDGQVFMNQPPQIREMLLFLESLLYDFKESEIVLKILCRIESVYKVLAKFIARNSLGRSCKTRQKKARGPGGCTWACRYSPDLAGHMGYDCSNNVPVDKPSYWTGAYWYHCLL